MMGRPDIIGERIQIEMFEEYAHGGGLSGKKIRFLLVIPAALVFCLAFAFFGFLTGLRSGKQEREIRRLEEETRALLDSIQIGIIGSGFSRRNVGANDIYVPMLTVLVSNVSASTIENLELMADFFSEGSLSCQDYVRIRRLAPGEITQASLKCIAPTGFGALMTGVPLSKTMEPVRFTVRVRHGDVYATVEQGSATFKLLGIAPPISVD